TANSPGLVVISWSRWSKPIWFRPAALPPAAAAMKSSCSMTLTFVWFGGDLEGRRKRRPATVAAGRHGVRTSTQGEVHRDPDATGRLLAAHGCGIEAPLARRFHRGAVEVAVTARLLDLNVGDVAVGVDVDDQDDLALDTG